MDGNVRDLLDEIKYILNIKTDQELAETLGVGYHAMVAWLQRDKVPDKWKNIIKNKTLQNNNNFIGLKNVGINNGHISISAATFDHTGIVKEIIELLKYAPPGYLEIIKNKLEEFKKMSEE